MEKIKEIRQFTINNSLKIKEEAIKNMNEQIKIEVLIQTEKMSKASIKFLKREKLRLIKEKNKILYEREETLKKNLKEELEVYERSRKNNENF